MNIRTSFLLPLACGFLLGVAKPANAATPPLSQLAARGAFLAATTFGVNFLGYSALEKLWGNKDTKYNVLRRALIGAVGVTLLLSDVCLFKAALKDSFWQDPNIFKLN